MSDTNSVYEMSDEDFAKLDLSTLDTEEVASEEEDEDTQEMPEDSEEDSSTEAEDDNSEIEEDEDEQDSTETEEHSEDSDEDDSVDEDGFDNDDSEEHLDEDVAEDEVTQDDTDDAETTDEEEDTEESQPSSKKEENDADDAAEAKAFYAKLTAPIKANGKEFTIKSAEDAIALIQQGINYSKNMADLKPSKAILKTLKEHNLTNADDISFLIDLHNKDPKAIAKLLKDSDINLYDFDTEQADGYAPSRKVIEPTQLDDVVESLKDNPSFDAVLDDVVTGWDNDSKKFITSNPNVLKMLTEQKQSGLYDKIVNAVEYQRMLGKLDGMSSIEAYSMIEQDFLSKEQPKSKPATEQKEKFKAPRPSSKKTTDNSKKRKASSPQGSSKPTKTNFNPLAISDEELLKSFT